MHFARQKIINKFVNVNQVILEILKSAVKLLIIVKARLVRLEQLVETIADLINVYVNKVLLEIHTIMVVKNQKNVKSITIVQRLQNVSLKMAQINVKMFVKVFVVDQMLIVFPKTILLNVNVDLPMKEIQKIEQMDVDQKLIHAQQILNAHKTLTVMELFANQLV
jgi:hypothetical protein